MRISICDDDPGYVEHPGEWEVFLDGKYLTNCLTADEEEGMAEVYTKDEDNKFIIGSLDRLVTHKVYGKITIKHKSS